MTVTHNSIPPMSSINQLSIDTVKIIQGDREEYYRLLHRRLKSLHIASVLLWLAFLACIPLIFIIDKKVPWGVISMLILMLNACVRSDQNATKLKIDMIFLVSLASEQLKSISR